MRISTSLLTVTILLLSACSRTAPPIEKDYPLSRITERVYVVHGPNEQPNKANQAFMNNPGFVLTSKGVVVIDPGSSLQTGEMLLKKIATLTKEPVIAVFNTHIHGDHWLANDAIHRAYPQATIYAHAKMIEKAATEGPNWVQLMNRLSDGALRGTEVVMPQLAADDKAVLAFGDLHLRIHHSNHAHTDGDLMIEVVEEKVLFLGDNVAHQRAVRMDDGNFKGNIEACELALNTTATQFVPGHGQSGGRDVVIAYRDWLTTLYAAVKKYQAQGLSDFEMKDSVVAELKPYHQWAMFETEIGKLVSLANLQAEQETF